jgi:hypothetical protein
MMIIEAIFTLLLFIPELILSLIPTVNIEIPDNIMDGANVMFGALGYFLPVTALLPIIIVSIGIDVARIVIAIIIRIKSFIPTMGA